jgi:hypothetical protein
MDCKPSCSISFGRGRGKVVEGEHISFQQALLHEAKPKGSGNVVLCFTSWFAISLR